MKLFIVSICKNEGESVGQLLDRTPKSYNGVDKVEIHIMDDGSTDETAAIAKKHGAIVHSDGASKGLAFRFREVLDLALDSNTDILVNIDGDLQFMPEDIPTMIKPIVQGTADFVAANRFADPKTGEPVHPVNMPAAKYWGNKLGARIVSKLAKRSFPDVTCGFRAYNQRAILALNLNSTHTYTQESFQVLAMKRLRIVSIPVKVVYFKERKSRVVSSITKYVFTSMLNIVRAYRDFAPLKFFCTIGAFPLIIGTAGCLFAGWHWLQTGNFSPYKFVGIGGLYLFSLGIFLCSLGLLADMFVRLQGTQERTYELVKRGRLK